MKTRLILLWGIMGVAVLFAGCGGGGSSPSGSSSSSGPVTTTGQYQSLLFTLTAPKRVYGRSEGVALTFNVKNTGARPVEAALQQSTLLAVLQNGRIVWNDPGGGGGGILTSVFAPGETKTYNVVWPGRDNGGNRESLGVPVSPGKYSIRVYLAAVGGIDGTIVDLGKLSAAPLEVEVR